METITSRTNSLITQVRKLAGSRKDRRAAHLMVCEGPKMLAEALQWKAELSVLLWAQGAEIPAGIPDSVRQVQVPAELLKAIAPTQTPQQVLFLCAIPQQTAPETLTGSRYLMLDGVQDPGNVGTLWRTADAFGADGLLLLPGCADPWSPKTLRATMGACFRLPVWEGELEEIQVLLERSALPLYATALGEDTVDLRQLSVSRSVVVIGSEGRGVSPAVLHSSAGTVRIPMTERCESLNAAAAGAVVLWELCKDRL